MKVSKVGKAGLPPALSRPSLNLTATYQMSKTGQQGDESWRVFCALEFPQNIRRLVLQHIERLKEAVPDAKASWSRDLNLHLTVKFLGEIPQSSVADVSSAASLAIAGLEWFSVSLEQTGAFPTPRQPRVLWIGINDPSERLAELHLRLEDQAANAGFARDSRPFHPHLTVARLRQPQHARTLALAHRELEFEPAEIMIAELLVIRSELSSEGSRYSVVSRHQLGVR